MNVATVPFLSLLVAVCKQAITSFVSIFYTFCFVLLYRLCALCTYKLIMSFVIETLFIGGVVLLLLLATEIVNFRKIFYSLKLPGPIPLPILGNGLLFLNKSPAGKHCFFFPV